MEVEEILIDHEERLANIEGLFPTLSREECKEITKETLNEMITEPEQWTKKQWDIVNQLRAEIKHIHLELHETKVKKKSKKYKEYEG